MRFTRILVLLVVTVVPMAAQAGTCLPNSEALQKKIAKAHARNHSNQQKAMLTGNLTPVRLESATAKPLFASGAVFVALPSELGFAQSEQEKRTLVVAGLVQMERPSPQAEADSDFLFAERGSSVYRVVRQAKGRPARFHVCGCPPASGGGAKRPSSQTFYRVPDGKAYAGVFTYKTRSVEVRYSSSQKCSGRP
jgi:hypothetical protein